MTKGGFTLVEILIIIFILIVLTGLIIPAFHLFQKELDLNNSSENIINTLRFAQNKALAAEGADQWGVYFSTSSFPHQYTLFKGSNFSSRDSSFDETYSLPDSIEFYQINLWEKEVVFKKVSGFTSTTDLFGSISLRLVTDLGKTKTVYIDNTGKIGTTNPSPPSDTARIKDSRHVHILYSGRGIATDTEKLILTFDGSVVEEIVIANYIQGDQIEWEGTVNVSGEDQTVRIHTHQLNNTTIPSDCPNLPCTIFSIHRDGRHNNKSLDIDIDGDSALTPNLIGYSADGLITNQGNSTYVSSPIWQ